MFSALQISLSKILSVLIHEIKVKFSVCHLKKNSGQDSRRGAQVKGNTEFTKGSAEEGKTVQSHKKAFPSLNFP